MTLRQAWQQGRYRLTQAGIPQPDLEAEVLLRHTLKLSRAQLFARWEEEMAAEQEMRFYQVIARRQHREPAAYLVGHREFYGLDFSVDQRALIPRPESELLVEKAIELARGDSVAALADIGTGCGAIAIALAHHLPQAVVFATDVSPPALELARFNLMKHRLVARVKLLHGDMLHPLPHPVDLIVANLPYVREDELEQLPPEVRGYEPITALNGGGDGLEAIRRLLAQVPGKLRPGGSFLLEVGVGQGEAVAALAQKSCPRAQVSLLADLAAIPRVVVAQEGLTDWQERGKKPGK